MWLLKISMLFVFFFKQKTAYEWRISDWTDVCSSDLRDSQAADDIPAPRAPSSYRARRHAEILVEGQTAEVVKVRAQRRLGHPHERGEGVDRKSVVSGKSVSVRVDLGGRRLIKNITD